MSSIAKRSVLFFIETGGPGGAEQVVLQLLEGFRERGARVALATLNTGWLTETATDRGFAHTLIASAGHFDLMLPLRIAATVRSTNATVLHTHLLDSNFYGAISRVGSGTRHVATEHGDIHHISGKKFMRTKLRVTSMGASAVTAVSDYTAKRLVALGVSQRKVHVVPNPMPQPHARSTSNGTSAVLEFDLPASTSWVWAHVANLRPVKDQETLLRAFAGSIGRCANQALLLVGDGAERPKLVQLSRDLGIEHAVRFLGHRDDVSRILLQCDGFVMTSLSESMPMSLLEAIAAGLFPLCTSVGGIPELLPASQLVTASDHESLSRKMTSAVNASVESRLSAAQLQTRTFMERSLTQVLDHYEQLYRW